MSCTTTAPHVPSNACYTVPNRPLLAVNADAKTRKGTTQGILTGILYLLPANLSGHNLCPFASAGCREACLNTAGRGQMPSVQAGRGRKSTLWFNDRPAFWAQLRRDLGALQRKADRENLQAAARLNGTSDIVWERRPEFRQLCSDFPRIRFYDYTKAPASMRPARKLPPNYDLTFSHNEDHPERTAANYAAGRRVAIVVPADHPALTSKNSRLVSGDSHDARFNDPDDAVVLLTPKGDAKSDTTGFVVRGSVHDVLLGEPVRSWGAAMGRAARDQRC